MTDLSLGHRCYTNSWPRDPEPPHALIADGHHARIDGLTSLAVLVGPLGIWLGFPRTDPIIGLLITVAILKIVWKSARAVFARALDGVDPSLVDEIRSRALCRELTPQLSATTIGVSEPHVRARVTEVATCSTARSTPST